MTWDAAPTSKTHSNLAQLIDNAKFYENFKYQEHHEADSRCRGNKSLLNEYNFKGFNSFYKDNVLSKWLEDVLRDGDLISDERLSDLILREIEKPLSEYTNMIDSEDSLFKKMARTIAFRQHSEF